MFGLDTIDEKEAKTLNPQVLAFVGDGVYSLYIRHKLMLSGELKGSNLHKEVINYVKASGQSNFIEKLLPSLSADELAIFKRARNHHTLSQPKNGNIIDYKRATGLEALIGYLYLSNKKERLEEILNQSIGEKNEN